MINSIQIKNFKSIDVLDIELGRLNVVIGSNGSGKTNILEAIAMGAAASANKLEYEFLGNRIRVTHPDFMRNAFQTQTDERIFLQFEISRKNYQYFLENDKSDYRNWRNIGKDKELEKKRKQYEALLFDDDEAASKFDRIAFDRLRKIADIRKTPKEDLQNFINKIISEDSINEKFSSKEISNFLIYAPELSSLRKFEEPAQIIPLGIRGEGLFHTLKQIISDTNRNEQLNDIKEYLHLLDWFDDFDIPKGLMSSEYKIAIKDRYLAADLNYFDQRSANEGFLFLLFYLVLFTSENTPAFFAIDNIENSFNPRLCTEVMKTLNILANNYNKQVIVTTHNPAILDGLDLKDDKQRLFIARRNSEGKTKAERLKHKPESKMKLSELWTRGIIGGLPDNF